MQRTLRMFLFAALTLHSVFVAVSVRAQESSPDPRIDAARVPFDRAQSFYEAGRYGRAAQEFRASYDLLAAAGHPRALMVLLNLGRALERIAGREPEARDAYQRVIDESPRTPAFEDTLQRATDGLHELDARTEGGAGANGTRDGTSHESVSPLGPIVLAVGGATLLSGFVIGGVSLAMASDFRGACDLGRCPTALRPQHDEMRTFSIAADVLMVAGGLVAALGLVLTLTLTEGESPRVSAACTDDGCLAVARGRF